MSRKQGPVPQDDVAEGSRDAIDKEPARTRSLAGDAAGQFRRSQQGRSNNGIASADPRALSGDEEGDATFPLKQDSR